MRVYIFVWLCMRVYIFVWLCMHVYIFVWFCMRVYIFVWLCMRVYIFVWLCMRVVSDREKIIPAFGREVSGNNRCPHSAGHKRRRTGA